MQNDTLTLVTDQQRLRLAPHLGGSVAAWEWKRENDWLPLLRPWDGTTRDLYATACFPLVPWSNRITGGGFEFDGKFHSIRPNRTGEAYPIHGDGWLQEWRIGEHGGDHALLELESHRFDGNPYDYRAEQRFSLLPDGLAIELAVTHLGDEPLPYGLGLHPYFVRNAATRLRARTDGVWLSGDDPIPVEHSTSFPPTWDYNQPAPLDGPMIDNCFTGWDGKAVIQYPDRGWTVTMTMADPKGYSLMYRPPGFDYFCYEPITQPIDAFHMPGMPGLRVLAKGESMVLRAEFTVG
jgi:aldose 1-epimerase